MRCLLIGGVFAIMGHLFTIEKAETLGQHGWLVLPGVQFDVAARHQFGQAVVLVTPDGRRVETKLTGIADAFGTMMLPGIRTSG